MLFTITITAAPVIECPADILLDANAGECISSLNPGIPTLVQGAQPIEWTWTLTNPDGTVLTGGSTSTNLDPLPEHIVPAPPHEYDFQGGITTITWTATNLSGVDECTQTITVIDDQPPTFRLPDPLVECVDFLFSGVYNGTNPNPNVGVDPNLILNPSPDYYTFISGDIALITPRPNVIKNN
jgi:large repetitive protein